MASAKKSTFLVLCDLGTVAKFEMPCSNPNHHSFGGSFVPILFHLFLESSAQVKHI